MNIESPYDSTIRYRNMIETYIPDEEELLMNDLELGSLKSLDIV